ncbi:MAG: phosphoribosylformimino-5-aminoimidazole carboxamide ribotide isomerase [Chitinivibrionales bacterium]|nr:phosphoribosylformimino-5-aminoimidazole carboxamide ribotide isomerase [Chitinivibrionales bacterium]
MRFRPCIDLHDGTVKQIVGSTLSDSDRNGLVTNFESEKPPAFYAGLYRKDNLLGGHIIMLGPGNEKAACEALAAYPGGMQVGGGITPDNSHVFLDAGASHVIVTSYVFNNGTINRDNLERIVSTVGKDRLVLDLSCKKMGDHYVVATNRWQKLSSMKITQNTLAELSKYCSEFLVHAADVEGKQQGIEKKLVALLGNCSPLPVTYAGGIRGLEDLEIILTEGGDRVDATIGSALDIFGGKVPYADVVAWHRNHVA